MRVYSVLVLCCVGAIQVAQTQLSQLGPIHLQGVVGTLPNKYLPLTKDDEYATYAISSVAAEVIHRLPNVYKINQVGPINIDLPQFWLYGKLNLNNIVLEGMSQAKLQHLEVRLKYNRVDFAIHAPGISGEVEFEFEGVLGVIPLYLSGSVSLNKQDLTPVGAVTVKKVTLPITGVKVFQVEGGSAMVDVQNVALDFKSTSAGDLDVDSDFIKNQVLVDIKDRIADIALSTIFKEVNKELAKTPPAWNILSLIKQS